MSVFQRSYNTLNQENTEYFLPMLVFQRSYNTLNQENTEYLFPFY